MSDTPEISEWSVSPETDKLWPALLSAQSAAHNAGKDSENSHFKRPDGSSHQFASLESVLDAIKPAFHAQGLLILQLPAGAGVLNTTVVHAASGQWLTFRSVTKVAKDDPQGFGAALTYSRRYSLASLACIGQEDDDGNAASFPPKQKDPDRVRTKDYVAQQKALEADREQDELPQSMGGKAPPMPLKRALVQSTASLVELKVMITGAKTTAEVDAITSAALKVGIPQGIMGPLFMFAAEHTRKMEPRK